MKFLTKLSHRLIRLLYPVDSVRPVLRGRIGYQLQTIYGQVIGELEPGWGRPIWCVPSSRDD